MNGWKFLRKLQAMPDEKKQAVAFFGAASITSVIFTVWLVLTLAAIDRQEQVASGVLSEQAASVIGPWEAITDQFSDIIATARIKMSEFKKVETNSGAVSDPMQ